MSFPYLIYFINIEMTSFHAFTTICGIGIVVVTFLLTGVHCLPSGVEGDN